LAALTGAAAGGKGAKKAAKGDNPLAALGALAKKRSILARKALQRRDDEDDEEESKKIKRALYKRQG
jgi:hypothetical protein